MNRIYKTVWNEQTGTFVATSEITRSRSKRSGKVAAATALAAALSYGGVAMAQVDSVSGTAGEIVVTPGGPGDVTIGLDPAVTGAISTNADDIVDLQTNKANQSDLSAAESRITVNEGDISNLQSTKADQADLTTATNRITAHDGAINTNTGNIANLTTALDAAGVTTENLGEATAAIFGGGAIFNADGTISKPTYTITQGDGSTTTVDNVGDALALMNGFDAGGNTVDATGIKYFHVKSTRADSQATGDDSVAIGPETVAGGIGALAAGHGATVDPNAPGGTALGKGAAVAADADDAVAVGTGAVGSGVNAVAVGTGTEAGGNGVALGNATTAGSSALAAGNTAVASGSNSVALGSGAQTATRDSIAIGRAAGQGTDPNSPDDGARHSHIAIGEVSGQNVAGNQNIGIGVGAGSNVSNDNNVAIGSHAGRYINGERTVAIGYRANEQDDEERIDHAVAIGGLTQAQTNAVALGYQASSGDGAIAIGEAAQATAHSVAIGQSASAEEGFVALGQNSAATAADLVNPSFMTGQIFNGTAVSVGNSSTGLTRRITNVADGAADTDAVNVAQLRALEADYNALFNNGTPAPGAGVLYNVDGGISGVNDGVVDTDAVNVRQMNAAVDAARPHYFSVDPNGDQSNKDNDGANGANSMAIGHAAQTDGASSLSVGHNARVSNADQATSVGFGTNAKADNSTAIGSESIVDDEAGVAIGRSAYSRGENSLAMGTDAQTNPQSVSGATSNDAIAFGTSSRATNDDASALGHSATASGKKATAIGFEANAEQADSAFAIGTSAHAEAENAHAQGTRAHASDTNAFAAGTDAHAHGANSIASGTEAEARTTNAIAMGHGAKSGRAAEPDVPGTTDTIAIGTNTEVLGQNALAVGSGNVVGDRDDTDPGNPVVAGADSGAFGNRNTIMQDNTFVVGNDVTTTQANSVVLGNASTDRAATAETAPQGAVVAGQLNGVAYSWAGTGSVANGVVSVGGVGTERQIINVAPGEVSAGSTDAINGSQLYAVQDAVEKPITFAGDAGTDVDRTLNQTLNVKGGESDPGNLTTEANIGVVANGSDQLDIRLAKNLSGLDSVQVGDVVINGGNGGNPNTIGGLANRTWTPGQVPVAGRAATEDQLAAAQTHYYSVNGTDQTAESNYLNDGATGTGALAAGVRAQAAGNLSTAVGVSANSGSERSIAVGYDAAVQGANSMAIGASAKASQANSVALGAGSLANEGQHTGDFVMAGSTATAAGLNSGAGVVSVGSAGAERQIQNVAPGVISAASTDAINGSQLYATNVVLGNVAGSTVTILGGDAAVDGDGNLTMSDIGGTGENNIHDAIQAATSAANAGWNYTVDGDATTQTNVGPDDTVDFGNEDGNILVSKSTDGLSFDLAPALIIGPAAGGNPITIDGNAGTVGGLTNRTWTSGQAPVDGQAATENQLAQLDSGLTSKGLDFAGDTGGGVHRDLGQELNVVGGATGNLTDGNIGVEADGDTLTVRLAENVDLGPNGSVQTGNTTLDNDGVVVDDGTSRTSYGADGMRIDGGPSVTSSGIDAGGQKITNVAAGTDDTDAVNVGQLKDTVGGITDADLGGGFGLADENGNAFKQDLGTAVKITGDGRNIQTAVVPDGTGGSALQVSLADQLSLGQTESTPGAGDGVDGSLAVNGQDGVAGVGLNGADGSIDLTNGDGDTTNLHLVQGQANLDDAAPGGAGASQRLEYTDANGAPQQVATMNDGLTFAGDTGDPTWTASWATS